jgi:outer membrane protein assembly factor BamB
MLRCIFVFACVFAAIPAAVQAGDNWPGWRGPTGMGLSDEKNLPLTWGGKAQENVLWKVPLLKGKVDPDHNQSSPIVWGDRVFVTVSYWPDGVTRKKFSEHRVHCFSTKDGKWLWEATVAPGPWLLNDFRGGGYACSTPATDGKRVYAVFGSAVIAAVDFNSGELVWRKEIKPHTFDVAFAASPVIFEDKVILVCDQMGKNSTIYAFDSKTGEVRWESKRPKVNWAHSTPLLAKVGDRLQLITATHNGPQGFDPASGEPLWFFNESKQVGDTVTPIVRDGVCYVDSGRGGNPGIAIDVTGSGDLSKTALKWKIASVSEGFSSPLLLGDYLYRVHNPGIITCYRWATGERVYQERLEGIETACSPVASADGRIYLASAGRSYVLKAGPTFEVLAKNELGDANRSSPAVAAGRIYLKGGRNLYCIGTK